MNREQADLAEPVPPDLTVPPEPSPVPWRRLSPRMLFVHPVTALVRAIPGLLALLFAARGNGQGEIWSLVGACLAILAGILRWLTTSYRITATQLQLRKGVIRRRTMDVPLDRVRAVDVTAHVLHRVLGLARVVIGTGTSDRRGRGGLELDGLKSSDAANLRAELLHRPIPQAADGTETTEVEPRPNAEYEIARLDPAWVRYAPFTLSGAVTALALAGFAWRIDQEARVNLAKVGPLKDITTHLRHTPIGVDITEITVIVIAFIALASTLGYVLSFWNFRLTRHTGGSLHISRGLLTSRGTSLERARLRGVEVSEPLLLRAVGGARCIAIATGLRVGRGSERGGTVLLPPAPRAQAIRVANDVTEARGLFSTPLAHHGRSARHRRYVRTLAAATVATAAFVVFGLLTGHGAWGLVAAPPLTVAALALASDRYHGMGHTLVSGYVVTRYGSIFRHQSAISCDAIIGWNMRSTVWQRRVGLTTLVATTAAGRQRYPIPDVQIAEALAFAGAGVPGLAEQFLR